MDTGEELSGWLVDFDFDDGDSGDDDSADAVFDPADGGGRL